MGTFGWGSAGLPGTGYDPTQSAEYEVGGSGGIPNLLDMIRGAGESAPGFFDSIGDAAGDAYGAWSTGRAATARKNKNKARNKANKNKNAAARRARNRANALARQQRMQAEEYSLYEGIPGGQINYGNIGNRVDNIIKKLIAQEKAQQQGSLAQLRKQYQRLARANAEDALAYDKITRVIADQSDLGNKEAWANAAAVEQAADAPIDVNPLNAASAADVAQFQAEASGQAAGAADTAARMRAGTQEFFKGMRGLNPLRAHETARDLRDAMAEARSGVLSQPLKSMDPMLREQLRQSMEKNMQQRAVLAQQMAGGREDIANSRFTRKQSAKEMRMKQQQFNMARKDFKRASKVEQENLINQVLYGKPEKIRVQEIDPQTGATITRETFQPQGGASNAEEAYSMLLNIGVGPARARRISQRFANEMAISSGTSNALSTAAGMFGGDKWFGGDE